MYKVVRFPWNHPLLILNQTYHPVMKMIWIQVIFQHISHHQEYGLLVISFQHYEFTGESHIRISCTEYSHPLEYFEAFVDEAMLNHIVEETNRYQLQNPIDERRNMAS